jgi:phage/plasmid-like protein (TIGR03299 family)
MMAFAGDVPWHRMGVSVGADGVDSGVMMPAAGLDWETLKVPVRYTLQPFDAGVFNLIDAASVMTVPEKFVTVRYDTGAPLGVVGADYEVFHNRECFSFMDAIASLGIKYHTAGALGNGSRVWIAGKLDGALHVNHDKIEQYMLLSTSHDGSLKVTVRFTPVRVVCQNTLSLALRGSKDKSSVVAVKHSGAIMDKLGQAQTVLNVARAFYDDMGGMLNRMAGARVTPEQSRKYVESLFGKGSTRARNVADRVLLLSTTGMGNDTPEVAGTVYGLYQGVTEYLTHERTVSGTAEASSDVQQAARMESLWFGTNADLNADAFALASKMADDLYSAPTVFPMS